MRIFKKCVLLQNTCLLLQNTCLLLQKCVLLQKFLSLQKVGASINHAYIKECVLLQNTCVLLQRFVRLQNTWVLQQKMCTFTKNTYVYKKYVLQQQQKCVLLYKGILNSIYPDQHQRQKVYLF